MSTTDWFVDLNLSKATPPAKEFQVQGSLKSTNAADNEEYGVTVGYEITQDTDSENKLAIVFEYKTSNADRVADITANAYSALFFRYRKKGDYGAYRFVTCGLKKGDNIADVNNFKIYSEDANQVKGIAFKEEIDLTDAGDAATIAFWEAHMENEFVAEGHFFKAAEESGKNYLRVDTSTNRIEARCIAELSMPKFDDGAFEHFVGDEIVGDYDVQIGAVVLNNPNDMTWNVHFEDKRTFTLKSPVYADSIAAEVSSHASVYFDRFMETDEITFSLPSLPNAVSGTSGSGL